MDVVVIRDKGDYKIKKVKCKHIRDIVEYG